jgi:hypothetical protein
MKIFLKIIFYIYNCYYVRVFIEDKYYLTTLSLGSVTEVIYPKKMSKNVVNP